MRLQKHGFCESFDMRFRYAVSFYGFVLRFRYAKTYEKLTSVNIRAQSKQLTTEIGVTAIN